jgi:hypothetical protein
MSHPILTEIDFKTYEKNVQVELEYRQLVRTAEAASKSRRPQRQRLPKTGALRRLVISLGHSAP